MGRNLKMAGLGFLLLLAGLGGFVLSFPSFSRGNPPGGSAFGPAIGIALLLGLFLLLYGLMSGGDSTPGQIERSE